MISLLALTGNNVLVSFSSDSPEEATSMAITGVDGTLLGIDTRPANGLVYGITDTDRIYTINAQTGEATFITTLSLPFNANSVSGFDFNPVADRLRLVGDNDQDFRINVETGEVTVDGDLAFADGDVNVGDNPSVTAAAYANSFAGTTTTALYDIDEAQDILVLQDPPNDGTLRTIGSLGVDFGRTGGFEIVSDPAGSNVAFAVSTDTLYSIDLSTGTATQLGTFAPDGDAFRGLTVSADVRIDPIAQGSQFLALTDDDKLISFDPNRLDSSVTIDISGLDSTLLGIDTRPANGLIYGITVNNTVYTIDPNTGVATQISTLDTSFNGTTVSGFDFNPVADRLRLVGDNDQDFRINVETGEVTVDGDLAFAAGDVNEGINPRVTAAAYENAISNPTTTELYDIDADLDILVRQDPPNDGTLVTVGSLGIDVEDLAGFDIISAGEGDNAGFAIADSTLFSVDLETGAAVRLGTITPEGADDAAAIKGLATVDSATIVAPIDPIAQGSQFLALTEEDKLVSFDPSTPGSTITIDIIGIDAPLLGIDTRPANGLIYGITTANTVYTINPNTGIATRISTLDESFNAENVSGFDFNPVADRLRLVGDNDQDFRINVDTGEVTIDGDLAYAVGDVNEGANPRVTAAAYANAIANPTTTALYDIDTDLDILALQNPPNDGILLTRGPLGIDIGEIAGFDIISSGEENVGDRITAGLELEQNAAFAVADGTLYDISILTGTATSIGTIGDGTDDFKGLATVDADTIVDPLANNTRFLALSDSNTLDSFAPGNPQAVRSIAISGLGDGETILGIDTRPANGLIYGITDTDNIYTIDPNSGSATFISTLDVSFNATTISGFDFNPVADRLRLVGDNNQDFRINVDTGEVTIDGDLAFASDDVNADVDPTVTAAAYINAVSSPSTTALYDIDTDLDVLVLQDPPNDGTLITVGELGVDFGELGGLDIVSPSEGSNAAFAVSDGTLYSIDLLTGEASSLGMVGDGDAAYQGLATISNDVIDPVVVTVDANADGTANAVVYDVTAANQVRASVANNPSLASDAAFDNFVGFYEVTGLSGGIDTNGDGVADIAPDDSGYAAAAISRRLDDLVLRAGGNPDDDTANDSLDPVVLAGGKFYAPFLIANLGMTTPEDFITNNPTNDAAEFFEDQVAYFSFIAANPDGVSHVKSLGNNVFGFEDLASNLGVSDNDFNDAVFQLALDVV